MKPFRREGMFKLLTMEPLDAEGQPRVSLIEQPRPGVKLANFCFTPEQAQFWSEYKPDYGAYSYFNINILGALERWGSNLNGDAFPLEALILYHKTFMQGHPFTLHDNDDTSKAMGKIVFSSWNGEMARVQVISRLFKEDGRVKEIERNYEAGRPSAVSMGCFLAGSLVTMADGTRKPIELVEVGDKVLTHTGKTSKVTVLHRRPYRGDAIGIKPAVGATFWSTPEHPFWATSFSRMKGAGGSRWLDNPPLAPEWIHSGCLDDHALLSPILTDTLTPDYVTRAFARLFGYYLAEGHVLRNKAKEIVGIELTTNKADPIHFEIESLCKEFGTKNPPAYHQPPHSESAAGIYIFDPRLAQLCYQHGGGYAKRKKFSAEAMRWDPEMQREVLGAYANGDGCATEMGALALSTASTDLAWQWITLLPRLGILASIQNLEHKAESGFSANTTYEWVIHIGKQWAQGLQDVCAKILPVEILAHRNDRLIVGDYVVTPIREKLTLFVDTEVFNLEIEDEDSSYLVYGVGAHNCKVPFDICSICSNHSRTRQEYCEHLKKHMNQLWPNPQDSDGRKVYALNTHPTFFDQSFVHVPADPSSGILAKIASIGRLTILSADAAEGKVVLSSEKESTIEKTGPGDATKKLPPEQARAIANEAAAAEEASPDLPEKVLEELSDFEPETIFGTLASLGITLRPREYTMIVLCKNASREAGRRSYRDGLTLCPESLDQVKAAALDTKVNPRILAIMKPWIEKRSTHSAYMGRRIWQAGTMRKVGGDNGAIRLASQGGARYSELALGAIEKVASGDFQFPSFAWPSAIPRRNDEIEREKLSCRMRGAYELLVANGRPSGQT